MGIKEGVEDFPHDPIVALRAHAGQLGEPVLRRRGAGVRRGDNVDVVQRGRAASRVGFEDVEQHAGVDVDLREVQAGVRGLLVARIEAGEVVFVLVRR